MGRMFSAKGLHDGLLLLVPLLLSLTVHEWAHAYSAYRLGDDTAARMGRLTLNPIPHIDIIGTILCPLLGIPFGWAKPVPVNPTRFRRDVSMRSGMMITAAAGPISNLILAVLCAVVYGVLLRFGVVHYGQAGEALLTKAIEINLLLFLFNFFPIPPLDGSRLVDGLLPYRFREAWEQFSKYSWIALLLVIFLGGRLLQGPFEWLQEHLYALIWAIVGG
jgi:Zn-dependent protease